MQFSALLFAFGVLVAGCGTTRAVQPVAQVALASSTGRVAFSMDQSVRVHHRAQGVLDGPFTEQREFRALVEQDETSLRVVILSPFGAAALMVSLSASGDIEIDVRMPMELPFPPAYILRDIQRAFYPSLDEVCRDDVDAEGSIHERQGCNDAFSIRYQPARNLNAAEQASGHVVFTTESYALDIDIHSPEAIEDAPSR